MSATFTPEDASTVAGLGFDAEISPPWLMLPAEPARTRTVLLKDGAGLSLQLANTSQAGIVNFKEQPGVAGGRRITLSGMKPGTVRLDARSATGAVQASLEITVKAQKKITAFIHFVFDKSGRTTRKGLTEAQQMMEVTNRLLLPQANVMLVRRDSGAVNLPFDLERGVPIPVAFNLPPNWIQTPGPWTCYSKDPLGPLGCLPPETQGKLSADDFNGVRINNILANILGNSGPKSDYNIFFARKLDDPFFGRGKSSPGAIAATGAFTLTGQNGEVLNSCLLPDISDGQVLAHEFVHFLLRGATFLTRTGHTIGQNDLMTEVPGPLNIKIRKQTANFINSSGS